MKIIKLKAENIKKLIAVEIAPTGNVVKITGKNASGKTSVLDAIYWALGGVEKIQAQPIRKGERKAVVELDLGEMVVKRTFNEGGTTGLTIENKDGLRFKSPQTLLDGLLGKFSFDPLEFMRQDPRKQMETLRALTGVDTSKLDGLRQRVYDERTAINRDLKRLEVQVEGAVVPKDPVLVDAKEVDVSELAGKISEATVAERKKDELSARYADLLRMGTQVENDVKDSEHRTNQRIDELEAQIVELQRKVQETKDGFHVWRKSKQEVLSACKEQMMQTSKMAEAIVVPDISALQTELKQAEQKNREVRAAKAEYEKAKGAVESAKEQRARLISERDEAAKKADELTEKITFVDQEKARQIAAAKFPLAGLGFGDGAVLYKDLPLDQASHAEQLRVSMAIAMALNPKLKVIRVSDGSLLDSDSMGVIEEMCKEQDYQAWVEITDESGKVGVVISEGEVVAVNEQ